jgi:SAM-dependent MidA family methyltransferase
MTASTPPSTLPPLTPAESEHSQAVLALVRAQIERAGGWLDFETFMDLALYAPGLGYYSAGGIKLGAGGDFTTAPETSDLFGECVARQCAELLAATGGGDILEFGAGTGRLAACVLETLQALGALPERYLILEVSADLAARQREHMARLPAALGQRVQWLTRWPQAPLNGVILANEVLDALPCQRFIVRAAERVDALGVGLAPDGSLIECARAASAALAQMCAQLLRELPQPLPAGYRSELCLRLAPWIAGVADCLEHGALLLFDYGLPRSHYYHPQRSGGTLRCHFKQRAHDDPLVNLGVQDITAWVDFTRVAEAADGARLEVLGFATQAAFLLGTGIGELADAAADTRTHTRRAGEARRLLLPGEMGEAFKVMALGRGVQVPLRGFVHQDLRRLL